jgi:hypothetical protein
VLVAEQGELGSWGINLRSPSLGMKPWSEQAGRTQSFRYLMTASASAPPCSFALTTNLNFVSQCLSTHPCAFSRLHDLLGLRLGQRSDRQHYQQMVWKGRRGPGSNAGTLTSAFGGSPRYADVPGTSASEDFFGLAQLARTIQMKFVKGPDLQSKLNPSRYTCLGSTMRYFS